MEKLAKYCLEVISKHPHLSGEINGLYLLCYNEIEEGGSETHEIELCYSAIDDLFVEEED